MNPLKPGRYIFESIIFLFEPFYIGKGKNDRLYHHLNIVLSNSDKKDYNRFKTNTIKKILKSGSGSEPYIFKLLENLTDQEAIEYERQYINEIGIRNNKNRKGYLTNITWGGIGGDTFTNNPNKELIRKKLSVVTSGENNGMFGRPIESNPSHLRKGDSHWNRDRIHSDVTRKKLSDINSGYLNNKSKHIFCYDKDLILIKEYNCIKDSICYDKDTKIKCSRSIYHNISIYKSYKDHYWFYHLIEDEDIEDTKQKIKDFEINKKIFKTKPIKNHIRKYIKKDRDLDGRRRKRTITEIEKTSRFGSENGMSKSVEKYDMDNNLIVSYGSIKEASDMNDLNIRRIPNICNRFKNDIDKCIINGFKYKLIKQNKYNDKNRENK